MASHNAIIAGEICAWRSQVITIGTEPTVERTSLRSSASASSMAGEPSVHPALGERQHRTARRRVRNLCRCFRPWTGSKARQTQGPLTFLPRRGSSIAASRRRPPAATEAFLSQGKPLLGGDQAKTADLAQARRLGSDAVQSEGRCGAVDGTGGVGDDPGRRRTCATKTRRRECFRFATSTVVVEAWSYEHDKVWCALLRELGMGWTASPPRW